MAVAQAQVSLSWDSHKGNLCNGLSSLQQNGEFVDMTLAADGHLVKVHQLVMALSSPYIKELMSSANCQHPVIFLNKISYTTLSAILEYVYTGEVLVPIDNLTELVEAGRELHIKGLEDMKLQHMTTPDQKPVIPTNSNVKSDNMEDEICYFEVTEKDAHEKGVFSPESQSNNFDTATKPDQTMEALDDTTFDDTMQTKDYCIRESSVCSKESEKQSNEISNEVEYASFDVPVLQSKCMQYTVSNQGSLQMILNRFVYYLKHTNRLGSRQWRCVDYLRLNRCPAMVVTRDEVVVQRMGAHTHSFHDKRILKKVQAGAIFTAIHDAEREGATKKNKSDIIDDEQ